MRGMVYTIVLVDLSITLIRWLVRSLFSFVSIEMNIDLLFRHPFFSRSCGISRELGWNAVYTTSLPMTVYSMLPLSRICAKDVELTCRGEIFPSYLTIFYYSIVTRIDLRAALEIIDASNN
jgi:hypothetical protein